MHVERSLLGERMAALVALVRLLASVGDDVPSHSERVTSCVAAVLALEGLLAGVA